MKNRPMEPMDAKDCCNPKSVTKNADAKHVMLVGNPNCGKSTLFNRLCNLHVRTGNYPGVTVSRHVGDYKKGIQLIDLPGIYSLSSATAEEAVATMELLDNDAELIVNIIDSTSLERSLYLTLELKMLGVPMLVVLNMWDEAKKANISIDIAALSRLLDTDILPISAATGYGIDQLEEYIQSAPWGLKDPVYFGSENVKKQFQQLADSIPNLYRSHSLFYAKSAVQGDWYPQDIATEEFINQVESVKAELKGDRSSVYETIAADHYDYIAQLLKSSVKQEDLSEENNLTTVIDKVCLNRYLAFPIFLVIMSLVYYISVTWLGSIVTDWTNDEFFGEIVIPFATEQMEKYGFSEWLTSFVGDGIIGGVGAVLGFVPQMVILFLLLSILEECGYMTRASFILDKLFSYLGLSGRAFIPYLIGSGCGVPGLMTARTLTSESERRITLFTTTMIPCGAKLPVIIVFASAIFNDYAFFAPGMYLMGILIVILSASLLKKFAPFKPSSAQLMLELPKYHIPSVRVVALTVFHRVKSFVIKAGTVIFMSVTAVWLLSSFGYNSEEHSITMVDDVEDSALAIIAKPITPIFKPIGITDFRSTVAVVTGLVAKENIVGTLAVLSGVDSEEDDGFFDALREKVFSINKDEVRGLWSALSFVVFNLFTIPCFAAVGVFKREIGSTKLFIGGVVYMVAFSYCLAMCIYNLGIAYSYGEFGIGAILSIICILIVLYILFIKKGPKTEINIPFKLS